MNYNMLIFLPHNQIFHDWIHIYLEKSRLIENTFKQYIMVIDFICDFHGRLLYKNSGSFATTIEVYKVPI